MSQDSLNYFRLAMTKHWFPTTTRLVRKSTTTSLSRTTSTTMREPWWGKFVKTSRLTVANAFSVAANVATITMQVDYLCSALVPCKSFMCLTPSPLYPPCTCIHRSMPFLLGTNAPSTNTMDREGGEPSYELDFNLCCCGKNNNCFGATCCAHNSIFGINRVSGNNNNKKELVSTISRKCMPPSMWY